MAEGTGGPEAGNRHQRDWAMLWSVASLEVFKKSGYLIVVQIGMLMKGKGMLLVIRVSVSGKLGHMLSPWVRRAL